MLVMTTRAASGYDNLENVYFVVISSLRFLILWLAPRAGKMKPILPTRDFPLCSRKSEILWCNLSAI